MYRTKKDVDGHVESLISKLPSKEFTSRGYSIGRLYFEVGDYTNCCRYVKQYLQVHGSNAAAHALLGQALQKLRKLKNALEELITSYELCPTQNSIVLNICEILATDEENTDPGRAKSWCEKAEILFPKHPVTFQLREKLLSMANTGPQALIDLLLEELAVRPKDVLLHIRLLKLYLKINNIEEAFTHSCNVEFGENNFNNNYDWYETIVHIFQCNPRNINDWLFQLLLLTVHERMCVLSITENFGRKDVSIFMTTELLHNYDQAIERVAKAGSNPGHGEFHAGLLKHHRSQFAFIAATLLLKREAICKRLETAKYAEPLMLIAWHSSVTDISASWVISAPEMQQKAVRRWYSEGSYRCSQSGHYLLSNFNNKAQAFLDRISQNCSGTHWRDKLYEEIFVSRYHLEKINTSHLVSTSFEAPALILPKRSEIEFYDEEAQRAYGNSLHQFVWLLSKYKEFSHFKLSIFDMLPLAVQNDANCVPESLCQMDVYAFLYCAALTFCQQRDSDVPSDKPKTLPANITDLLCPLPQMKWWDCAYKFSQNELGAEMTDIRVTLSRGIEIVRCVDNHGIEPELLCDLGRTFGNRAKLIRDIHHKHSWELRAVLYYTSAINLLENKSTDAVKKSEKQMFKKLNLLPKNTNSLLEECRLYVAIYELNNNEYEKAIELLSPLKSAQCLYHLSVAYKKMALNVNKYSQNNANDESNSKYPSLLSKAQKYAHEAHYKLKDPENKSNRMLLIETEELINELDLHLNEWSVGAADNHVKHSSDEYISLKSESHFSRNFTSTPKRLSHLSMGHRDIHNVHCDQQVLEPNDKLKASLLNRDIAGINDLIDLTRSVFEENRLVGNQIISTINSNMQNTVDQFALLKISVDQVKDQINECRKECKEVTELKKQITELKKDISKIKKASEQTINDNELFTLEDGYATNETASNFAAPLPFTAQQVMPPFNQRLMPPFTVPPNPFQLYGQNLFNLYSQFSQPSSVPGAPPIFDAARPQVNYPGVFTNPDQMYLDVAHLAQQTAVPVIPVQASVTATVAASTLPVPHSTAPVTSIMTQNVMPKDSPRSIPANVAITSSDPLAMSTNTPVPVNSVTIPPKHIKGIPHNYQIQMPATEPTPAFGFPSLGNKTGSNTESSNWTQNTIFKDSTPTTTSHSTDSISFSPKLRNPSINEEVLIGAANDSHNKSRTLSEKSNTSIDNYDPCPDFKPIIPLPAEVKVTTGEENETDIFSARAKLYRFVDNQWKERGLGDMKLLKHKTTGKVRVLMRREQIHKICANHAITSYMEIKPMKNETKAYIWVANDFADETLVLEKFCVRFKTADIARQFYETFEKARSEATTTEALSAGSETPVNPSKSDKTGAKTDVIKTIDMKSTPANDSQPAKTVFGGFTFSSKPAFKTIEDTKSPRKNLEITPTNRVNVFSGLNFKTEPASSPFSNLFSTSSAQTNNSNTSVQNIQATDKFNTLDTVEEYEPTGEFTPVVPLPALVDTKTGEEDEIVLFEHRAKLLRFVAKEWKERGLGNIKILVNKDNPQKLRLLMRREQVMKVCCNHAVTKEITFQKMPNVDKAVTWCAQDFSEGELRPETFCLRFKTVHACNNFIDVVKAAQSKLRDGSKAAKEVLNAAKQNSQTGIINVNKSANSNWGDKFKPKQGSWECKECFVRNEANVEICPACNSPKPGSATANIKTTEIKAPNNEVKFKFGTLQKSNPIEVSEQKVSNAQVKSSWGDMFKPAAGTWECKQCMVRNEGGADTCCACNSPKDPNAASKPIAASSTFSTPKFNFGIPPTSNINEQKANTTSIFDGTGAHKFNFGIPTNLQVKSTDSLPKNDTSSVSNVLTLGTCKTSDDLQTPKEKPALLPTPQKPNETATFDFVFKPKPQIKTKSPAKSPKKDNGQESDGNEYASEDEGHHIHITPIIPLPDEVKVVTGEEDEHELFAHRAKLLIFVSGEWKERGLGIVKILQHKHTSKLRVIMRREQVLKICLNHALTSDITYNLKDEKNWIFAANDFSEGELTVQRFCLKFKTKEIAMQFKDVIDKARDGKSNEIQQIKNISKPKTQIKAKSPSMLPKKDNEEESDRNENASEDEGHHIHITPIIPLPDEVEVVTGEDDEDELFAHRAKLMIFVSGEWKERGLGIVKILQHKHTSKLRVIMRREQDLKICLNHALTSDITYNLKDEKNWIFAANDFIEGELIVHRFCLKFNTKEIAMQFKDVVDRARDGKIHEIQQIQNISVKSDNDNDDVEFITETQSDSEEKKKALELMLPENFFLYKNKDPCRGCRGCDDSNDTTPQAPKSNITPSAFTAPTNFSIPLKIPSENNAVFTLDKVNATETANSTNEIIQKPKSSSVFRAPMLNSSVLLGSQTSPTSGTLSDPKSIFATANSNLSSNNSTLFGFKSNNNGNIEVKSVFGATANVQLNDGQKPDGKSSFGVSSGMMTQKPFNLFSQNDGNTFVRANNPVTSDQSSAFDSVVAPNYFGNDKSTRSFYPKTDSKASGDSKSELVKLLNARKEEKTNPAPKILGSDSLLSFSTFKSQPEIQFQKNPDFKWEGAGQQLFVQAPKTKSTGDTDEVDTGNAAEEEYDPHYEPIVPLPDKITVTTGEEDEEKLFGRRCKLFRYNDTTREWKERGIGELKILYHPVKKTYRLLFRREQVHKAVLNMLIFMDLELLPMSKSDRAWTWAGRNYAENPAGDQETLAVRFKTLQMATEFFDKVKECVRELQAAAAQVVRKENEMKEKPKGIPLLRLPKHLQESARFEYALAMKTDNQTSEATEQPKTESAQREVTKRLLFHDVEQHQEADTEEAEDYEHEQVYYQGDDYDTYYNEDEESGTYFSCDCEAEVAQSSAVTSCAQAHVQVLFDHVICAPKIQLTNMATGELLADMLINDETDFQLSDAMCSWTGPDYSNNDPLDTTVTLAFPDSETAMQFYESCEASKEHNSAENADTEA